LVEELEARLVLSGPQTNLTVPLDPVLDQYGDQIVTVQAYQDSMRWALGIFDTGAAALTFAAANQAKYKLMGMPIPIQAPGGARADGIGGPITGDVGKPPADGTGIMATGIDGAGMTWGADGPVFNPSFGQAAITPGIRAFVGTPTGSPDLPTITGMPIMKGGSSSHPGPYAALINMGGASLSFPGLSVSLPGLSFVEPGTQLSSQPGTTNVVQVPLSFVGGDDQTFNGVTEAGSPAQADVSLVKGTAKIGGQTFVFDTGAQMTAISTADAEALGLDLAHPTRYVPVGGVGGTENLAGYTLNELDLPLAGGGLLQFTNVPVFVMNLGNGLDGLLGMNLWNNAYQMLYDPYGPGGASLSLTFHSLQQVHHGSNGDDLGELQALGLPLAGPTQGPRMTTLEFTTGDIHGQVFQNDAGNGIQDGNQPGLAGQAVFLDLNGNGQYDSGEPVVTTDSNGFFQFNRVNPGTYTVREVLPSNMVMVPPTGGAQTVTVQANATTDGVNFANMPLQINPFAAYVTTLYGNILNRAPDTSGFNYWVQYLQSGGSQDLVSQAFWESIEHRQIQVEEYYQYYLGRQVDPSGLNNWTNYFLSGGSEIDVQVGLLASGEYQASHPGNASFLNSLYAAVLGRAADAAGLAIWTQAMQTGMTPDQVARGFLTSGEAYQRTVDNYYVDYLHRPPDDYGQKAWVGALESGQKKVNQVAEGFLASGEYFDWAKQFSR
jgi:hypothetical protein